MSPRRRSEPVNRHWTGFASGVTLAAFSAGTIAKTLLAAQHDRETILRIRGSLMCYIDAAAAPGILVEVAVGFILVPEGTGTTVLWSPATDADAPWMYYTSFLLGYEEMVTDVVDVPSLSGYREVIDSKAMRRVRNQELQVVVENTSVLSAKTVNLFVTGRILSQE